MEIDPRDLVAQGDPETVVLLPSGALVGLHIRGITGRHLMLGIREDECGRPEACAITNELYIDTSRMQSNPRRWHRGDEA